MLTEDEKQIVYYLRQSPKDSLKRDAANLIEKQNKKLDVAEQALKDIINECETYKPNFVQRVANWINK